MNVFELLLHDPRQESTLGSLQNQWSTFINHITTLESCYGMGHQEILQQGAHLWAVILHQSPQIMKMFR